MANRRLGLFFWALYDFANTIFTMNVVSLYFPLLITSDFGGSDMFVSVANSISMLLVVLLMPFLGALSDRRQNKPAMLNLFTALSVLATFALGAVAGDLGGRFIIFRLVIIYIFANFFYQGALVFYNALLERVSTQEGRGKASGYGVALGYAGSILGMVFVLPFNTGELFGLDIPFMEGFGRAGTFFPTAALFLLFALPAMIYFARTNAPKKDLLSAPPGRNILKDINDALFSDRHSPRFRRFLLANFLFNDGIQTAIVFMAVFAHKIMGIGDDRMTIFFVVSTVGALIGAVVFGFVSDRFGRWQTLLGILAGWVLTLFCLALFPKAAVLWTLGMPIGALLGGVWTTARPLVLELAPSGSEGRYFGLYAFSGKLAAVVGPLLWGLVVFVVSPFSIVLAYRLAVFSMGLIILAGGLVLFGMGRGESV